MNLTAFKSGQWVKHSDNRSFSPAKINHTWSIDDDQVNYLLSRANLLLGELNGFSKQIPDIDFFIRMHVFKEATTSSQIEGTQTNMAEAFQKIEYISPERRDDWCEVQNYINAMNFAISELNNLPLCNRLLREAHKILMNNARGESMNPGNFRTIQNWIGGSSLNDAIFVPPCHTEVVDLMSDLELFLNNNELKIPTLIKIAIGHYQFETIHPFLDGNGRIGRLLITLYLVKENILTKPTLYLSDFFCNNRQLYYDNLRIVSFKDDMTQWLKFFLVGVIETSEKSISTFEKILKIKTDIEQNGITKLGKRVQIAQALLKYLFSQPIVDINDVMKQLNISNPTALKLVNEFISLGILKDITGYKRNRSFVFDKYMRLFG